MNKLIKLAGMLRKKQTDSEKKLWSKLRCRQLHGIKFQRQYCVGNYIIDFYSPSLCLGIEIDGPGHYTKLQQQKDKQRTLVLNKKDVYILRFSNSEVLDNIDGVCEKILTYPRLV